MTRATLLRAAITLTVLALALPPAALADASARAYWPAAVGDEWRLEAVGAPPLVLRVSLASDGWVFVDGLLGGRWWWIGADARIWTWNSERADYSLVFRVSPGDWAPEREDASGLDGAAWRTTVAPATTLAGRFDGCAAMDERTAAASVPGRLVRLVLAPGIGPVAASFARSDGGVVAYTVVRATVGGQGLAGRIPARAADAPGGRAFAAKIAALVGAPREEAILAELVRGNVPDALRGVAELELAATGPSGRHHTATLRVLPDVLAVGSDADGLRVPLWPATAQRVADAWGLSMITRRISDEVYLQAALRLAPQPLAPGPLMSSVGYYLRHHESIERVRKGRSQGELIAGHKKDVVLSARLASRPGKVAIYGWHTGPGAPIQPLSTIHADTYVDYSHGIRLCWPVLVVDGEERALDAVLRDPELCRLVSDEGPLAHTRIPLPK